MDDRIHQILKAFCQELGDHLRGAPDLQRAVEALREEGLHLSLVVKVSEEPGSEETPGPEDAIRLVSDAEEPTGPRQFNPDDHSFFEELQIRLPGKGRSGDVT